ncbi:MAG: hypothetical protein FJ134_07005 [Deltaproteobacteria bacterium]|nr:hypothetical protein [Deltaproteobacteria bacterium]
MKLRKNISLILAVVLSAGLVSQAAFAGLAEVGPLRPIAGFPTFIGFPQWYKDTNGTMVEMPIPPAGFFAALVPPTMIFDAPIPGNAFSAALGFGSECFYWYAAAAIKSRVKAVLTLGLEASFGAGLGADPTSPVVFQRVRLQSTGPFIPGTYTVKHPYGTFTVVQTAALQRQQKGVRYVNDIGAIPNNFTAALTGPIGPFLKATAVAPGVDPTMWLGDGVTTSTVTGSPLVPPFNKFRLEGPPGSNLDGRGNNFVETDLFTISAKSPGAISSSLTVDRLTYNAAVPEVDVFAVTDPDATVTVSNGATVLFTGTANAAGKFAAQVPYVAPLPRPLTISALAPTPAGGLPFTAKSVNQNPVDVVTITQADYSLAGGTLTIAATSSDPGATLTATGLGAVNPVGVAFPIVGPPPATVEVTSTMVGGGGGKDTALVNIVP